MIGLILTLSPSDAVGTARGDWSLSDTLDAIRNRNPQLLVEDYCGGPYWT